MFALYVPIEIVRGAESFDPRTSLDLAPVWFLVSQVMLFEF
jgi:hypothetical protein